MGMVSEVIPTFVVTRVTARSAAGKAVVVEYFRFGVQSGVDGHGVTLLVKLVSQQLVGKNRTGFTARACSVSR